MNAFKRIFGLVCLSVLLFGLSVFAQVASTPAAALQASGGVSQLIANHGGYQASAVLLVFSVMTMLSALRTVLLKFDGIKDGEPIPADKTVLTKVNIVCIYLGHILDFLTGNVQHL